MNYKTNEDRIKAVAKYLLKEFKASKDQKCIPITKYFTDTSSNKYSGWHKVFEGDVEIDFGELSDEAFGAITCKIADAICAKLKTKKNEIVYRDEKEDYKYASVWSSYRTTWRVCRKILIVRPCKGFAAINKKLKALGLKEIFFKDWYHCEVAGKRSSIFSRHYTYFAENETKCQKVLAYLKGKKKLAYDFVNDDDLSDRRRGEEYETEWYGSEAKQIRFTDARGKTATIY